MKELTYLHCQCFAMNNVVNSLYNYMMVNAGTAAIFVILDSSEHDKRIALSTMRKMMAKQV